MPIEQYRLNIFCAGVSMKLIKETAEKWNVLHHELLAVVTPAGSVDLIRSCLAGEPCDVLISADDTIIRTMMIPQYADGYRIWAGNKMVVTGEDITSENWEEKLLAPDATFKHHNPYGDPSGYRAVMAMLLADLYKPGLADRLMNHPGHIGMEKLVEPFGNQKEVKYEFTYYSSAKSLGKNFAELPVMMDLSDTALADTYEKINFSVDDWNTVCATPIAHALTIPKTATHTEAAKEFVKMFLALDKEAAGFLPREGVFGGDPVN
jgi:molybdate/tungstate transport system substrate-binding protein